MSIDSVNNTIKLPVHGQGYVTEKLYVLQFIILYLKQCRTINWCVKNIYLSCGNYESLSLT